MEAGSVENDSEDKNIREKIALMMYGFGDSSTPNPETVQLVESLVRKQLREMLVSITSTNTGKNYKIINSEDIIFYLRHNKEKVHRLVKYINFKYHDANQVQQQTNFSLKKTENNKLTNSVKQFIDLIDETGELSDLSSFDPVKHSRMLRAERISSSLDNEKYLEYVKARSVAFVHRKFKNDIVKFAKWIDPQNDFHIRGGAMEILSFLAYGIIANVIDMALIIRENNTYQANDPLQMKIGHYHNSMMFNVPHIDDVSHIPRSSKDINKGQQPITVNEMHEVIRRCYMPQIGYMNFSNKSILGKRKLFY